MNKVDKEAYLINRLNSNYIGDDAAVVGNTLYSMDAFFEDTHFKREWMSMTQIARKAMLVNISDAIAMNATPKFALVTLSIPKDLTLNEIDELTVSLEATAKEFGCEIIGGDTIASDKLHISITIVSKSENPLLRTTLKDGDLLAYTGSLGESKRDLDKLFNGETIDENSKFLEPVLRAGFVYEAREYLTAGMDISDGLFCDTNKILDINKYGFIETLEIAQEIGFSGEEYEMLVSFKEENFNKIKEIAKKHNTPLTVFAKVTQNNNRYKCKGHHF